MLHCSIKLSIQIKSTCVKYINNTIALQHRRATMEPATVVIKKYGNRRLYDTAGSRYVNLDDIEQALARTRKAGRAAEPEPALT